MVLLVSFLQVPGWVDIGEFDLLDFFAGRARISKLAKLVGYRAGAYDINFHKVRYTQKRKRGKLPRSSMDLNGPAGLSTLDESI